MDDFTARNSQMHVKLKRVYGETRVFGKEGGASEMMTRVVDLWLVLH